MDAVTATNKLAFVRAELSLYSGPKRDMGAYTFVLCPFHAERTPSGRVFHSESSRSPGYFKCYGCGKHGPWDEVAPKLGLKPFKAGPPKEEYAIDLMAHRPAEVETDEAFRKERQRNIKQVPRNKFWREIPTSLLRKIGAHTAEFYADPSDSHDGYWTGRRLYLPVLINGELRGYIKARMRKHPDYPSYINAPGSWSRTHGLFPYDSSIKLARKIAKRTGKPVTVVLVEGQRDALRLLALGIPAMCILGTQSWSATKRKLLELGDVQRVITFFDGDCAGIEATEKVASSCREMFDTRVLKLWKMKGSPWLKFAHKEEPSKAAKKAGVELYDPGNCPEWILEKIKKKYFT